MTLRVHAILNGSRVNGPGERLVIWTQGCGKACPGCFNPETWAARGGTLWEPEALAEHVRQLDPYGLTLTGGDPLEQPEAMLAFLRCLHQEDGSLDTLPGGIICFSGYTLEEIEELPAARACLSYIDLLIDGRYVEQLKRDDALAGSANQRFHFSSAPGRGAARIRREDVEIDQEVEVFPLGGSTVAVTGFPAIMRGELRRLGLRVLPGDASESGT